MTNLKRSFFVNEMKERLLSDSFEFQKTDVKKESKPLKIERFVRQTDKQTDSLSNI
jgi:hypothetical protein